MWMTAFRSIGAVVMVEAVQICHHGERYAIRENEHKVTSPGRKAAYPVLVAGTPLTVGLECMEAGVPSCLHSCSDLVPFGIHWWLQSSQHGLERRLRLVLRRIHELPASTRPGCGGCGGRWCSCGAWTCHRGSSCYRCHPNRCCHWGCTSDGSTDSRSLRSCGSELFWYLPNGLAHAAVVVVQAPVGCLVLLPWAVCNDLGCSCLRLGVRQRFGLLPYGCLGDGVVVVLAAIWGSMLGPVALYSWGCR